VARNISYKATDLKLFEFGKTYQKVEGKYTQQPHLCLLQTGDFSQQNWISNAVPSSFFHLKTSVTNLLNRFVENIPLSLLKTKVFLALESISVWKIKR
jgi:phenylalanyl-tRNA synthetase beta chain